jgi:hypothetical protein
VALFAWPLPSCQISLRLGLSARTAWPPLGPPNRHAIGCGLSRRIASGHGWLAVKVEAGKLPNDRDCLASELGRMGMASINEAENGQPVRGVAVKIDDHPGVAARRFRWLMPRVRTGAQPNHPPIVIAHDIGGPDHLPFKEPDLVDSLGANDRSTQSLKAGIAIGVPLLGSKAHIQRQTGIQFPRPPPSMLKLKEIAPDKAFAWQQGAPHPRRARRMKCQTSIGGTAPG